MRSSAARIESCEWLQQQLAAAFPATPGQSILIGLSQEGHECYAASSDEDGASAPIRLGCITKLFTNALFRRMALDRQIPLDAPCLSAFAMQNAGKAATVLSGTTLRHLMEHAHGLDASGMHAAPRDARGYIDAVDLFEQLSAGRLAPPGEICSYGHTGAWICALLLERTSGTPFARLLGEILPPLLPFNGRPADICPAQGLELTARVDELMKFLLVEMRSPEIERMEKVRRRSGFSALDEGTCLGWSVHGSGWLGHNSVLPGAPALVRIHPARRIALIVASNRTPPVTVLARILGGRFPELLRMQAPSRLDAARTAALDMRPYEGEYANRRTRVELSLSDTGQLIVRAFERARDGPLPIATTTLAPARQDVLLAKPAHPLLPRYFQLLDATPSGFRYLWDGESVLPRCTETSRSLPASEPQAV